MRVGEVWRVYTLPTLLDCNSHAIILNFKEIRVAGTDRSQSLEFAPSPAIILCEPQLGENIGATARAMANFGLWDLRLVNPRDGWPNKKAISSASKADHVIERTQVFDRVEDAIADLSMVVATTARKRELMPEIVGPDVAMQRASAHISAGAKVGILFGRERWGLNNKEIALSDTLVTLPVVAAFASLNISQAVLVLAYEWRRIAQGGDLLFAADHEDRAERSELIGMFEHLEEALDRAGFFKTEAKKPSAVRALRTMLMKADFTAKEVRTFRGVVASIDRRHERPNPYRHQIDDE